LTLSNKIYHPLYYSGRPRQQVRCLKHLGPPD